MIGWHADGHVEFPAIKALLTSSLLGSPAKASLEIYTYSKGAKPSKI